MERTTQSHHKCQQALSVPTVKISMRLADQQTQLNDDSQIPPLDSHPPQALPSHHLCQQALSVPTTKRSRRFAPQLQTPTIDSPDPFERLPFAPASLPPQMPDCMIGAESENIKTARTPSDSSGRGSECAAERFPPSPCLAVPPFVPECMVLCHSQKHRDDWQPMRQPLVGIR